jgi:site-specific recombinase XerD
MATINFYLEKKKNVSEQNIFARCKNGKSEFKYYLTEKIATKEWNTNTQRVRGTTTKAVQINSHIDTIQNILNETARDLKMQAIKNGLKNFDTKDWQNDFNKKIGNNNPNQMTDITLPELIDKYMALQKNTLKNASIKSYVSAKNFVVKFLNERKIKKIDYENFYIPFLNFLVETSLNNRTINIYITKIKTTMQYFLDYTDFLKNDPKLRLWKNLKTPPEKHITFSEDKALNLYKMDFPKEDIKFKKYKLTKKNFRKIVDAFIFSFYTGLARNEINNMKTADITAKNTLSMTRQKTNKTIEIPLNDICLEIIQRYKPYNNPKIIPKANAGTTGYNEFLKKILQHSKFFKEEVTLTKYIGTDKIEETMPLWKAITFHSARHSYATYMLGKGLAITDVQKLLGHSSVVMTEKYAHVLSDELMERARKILDKKINF